MDDLVLTFGSFFCLGVIEGMGGSEEGRMLVHEGPKGAQGGKQTNRHDLYS